MQSIPWHTIPADVRTRVREHWMATIWEQIGSTQQQAILCRAQQLRPFDAVPHDLVPYITDNLTSEDMHALMHTCRALYSMIRDNRLCFSRRSYTLYGSSHLPPLTHRVCVVSAIDKPAPAVYELARMPYLEAMKIQHLPGRAFYCTPGTFPRLQQLRITNACYPGSRPLTHTIFPSLASLSVRATSHVWMWMKFALPHFPSTFRELSMELDENWIILPSKPAHAPLFTHPLALTVRPHGQHGNHANEVLPHLSFCFPGVHTLTLLDMVDEVLTEAFPLSTFTHLTHLDLRSSHKLEWPILSGWNVAWSAGCGVSTEVSMRSWIQMVARLHVATACLEFCDMETPKADLLQALACNTSLSTLTLQFSSSATWNPEWMERFFAPLRTLRAAVRVVKRGTILFDSTK
jgi:hypothetical protein